MVYMRIGATVKDLILRALREELLTRRSLDALPGDVWKRTCALNTWGTNAIEGNSLPWPEVKKLLLDEKSVPDRPVADVLETLQHEAAFRSLLERKNGPLSLVVALELHEAVFRGRKGLDSGQWRRHNVRIAGSKHAPPRWEKVVPEMEAWLREYDRREIAGEDALELAAWMHHRFESIHPFSDGNGRVGRLLLNLHFLRKNWPPVHVLPPDRAAYLGALEKGQEGAIGPLVGFVKGAMARSLLDLLDQVGVADDELRPLKSLGGKSGYSAHYLALRALQGKLPAIKVGGRWKSSARALRLYPQESP